MTRPAMRLSIFSVQDHYPASARTLPQLYGQVIAQAELADRLGYDTFFVAEHHFHEYGAVPNPSVMLSTLAQRTKRLRLGSAISILTFHHPLTVAESYAMVDVLSGIHAIRRGVATTKAAMSLLGLAPPTPSMPFQPLDPSEVARVRAILVETADIIGDLLA